MRTWLAVVVLSAALLLPLTAKAEIVHLKPEHANALVGTWEGTYIIIDPGWKGRGTIGITWGDGGAVQAYFEYRWRGGGYDRYPEKGTIRGEIADDGKLHFGDWTLTLDKSGDTYTFKATERLDPGLTNFKWSREGVVLE